MGDRGNFGGLLTKAVWFLFGLVLSALAITGLAMFWARAWRSTPGLRRWLLRSLHPWRGAMAWAKPLNWVVIAVSVVAGVMTVTFYLQQLDDFPARYAARPIGPWQLGVTLVAGLGDTSDPVRPGASAMALVNYCPGCWPAIRRAWVAVSPEAPDGQAPGMPVHGQPGFGYAGVMLPAELEGQHVWLIAEGWDGRRHVAGWPLVPEDQ